MIVNSDALTHLMMMDDESVHCAITSPPYFGLRDYKVDGQIGLEKTPEEYVGKMMEIFHELKRVLRSDGTFFLNIGDSYASHAASNGISCKQLVSSKDRDCFSESQYDERTNYWWNYIADISNRRVHEQFRELCLQIPGCMADMISHLPSVGSSLQTLTMQSLNAIQDQVKILIRVVEQVLFVLESTKHEFYQQPLVELMQKDMLSFFLQLLRAFVSYAPECEYTSGESSGTARDTQNIFLSFVLLRSHIRCITTYCQFCLSWLNVPYVQPYSSTSKNIKPKDLIGIPWLLAFALRADGWYLRADLPWIKRNSMPSSVTDRPASSIEHVFLFSKSRKYYYDHIATMQPSSESYNKDKRPRGVIRQKVNENTKYDRDDPQYAKFDPTCMLPSGDTGGIIFKKQDLVGNNTYTGFNARYEDAGTGLRFMRDNDFFFRTWQGLLHNEDGEPMALVVNPRGYKGAHFACFPIQLVEPMILAGTSEKGVCPECGSPWVRNVNKVFIPQQDVVDPNKLAKGSNKGLDESNGWNNTPRGTTAVETTGWKKTCTCEYQDPIPATVLDPFAGSSATGVACKWHNRNYIGIELNPEYCKLGNQRIEEGK